MTKATREEMKEEAIKRLTILGVMQNVINDFKEGTINKSITTFLPGILYWVQDEELKGLIKEAEETYNVLIYHVVENNYQEVGLTYTMLVIKNNKEEWEDERKMLSDSQIALSIVHNVFGFEYGDVVVAPANGGVKRVY